MDQARKLKNFFHRCDSDSEDEGDCDAVRFPIRVDVDVNVGSDKYPGDSIQSFLCFVWQMTKSEMAKSFVWRKNDGERRLIEIKIGQEKKETRASVTRWIDLFSIFGHLAEQWEFAKK